MNMDACAYTFLYEDGSCCDYEVATDMLASYLGITSHYVKHIDSKDLIKLIELVYHGNGSIRGRCAIEESDYIFLRSLYDKYHIEMKKFVLPFGTLGSSHLHYARSYTKAIIRIMNKVKKEKEIEQILFDFFNLLSNTLFMMALYENSKENHDEREFISKSYGC